MPPARLRRAHQLHAESVFQLHYAHKGLDWTQFACLRSEMTLIRIQNDDESGLEKSGATLADSIRRTLADEIFSGAIEINERLDEQVLADRFNVSRTPVREALRQLASAGLIELKPRRGAVVVPSDPNLVSQAFEAAAELEALLAGKAAVRASLSEMVDLQSVLAECERAVPAEGPEPYSAANRRFHNTVGELARNDSLVAATRIVRIQTAPYQRVRFAEPEERRQSQTEHAAIVDAICRQDPAAASKAMKDHILRASIHALKRKRDHGEK